jgi:hypothetical protein
MELPPKVAEAFTQFRSAEFGTLARDGVAVAVPLSPLWQPARERFLVTTGIGLPYRRIMRAGGPGSRCSCRTRREAA